MEKMSREKFLTYHLFLFKEWAFKPLIDMVDKGKE